MTHALRYRLGTQLVHPTLWLMQPRPVRTGGPSVHDLVIVDLEAAGRHGLAAWMRERKALGLAKYGTVLQAGNGRDAMLDARQEVADALVYLRQAVEEGIPGAWLAYQLCIRLAVVLEGSTEIGQGMEVALLDGRHGVTTWRWETSEGHGWFVGLDDGECRRVEVEGMRLVEPVDPIRLGGLAG